jgi:hypothetical protein
MQIPSNLCGIDLLFCEWVAIAAYLALGAWLWFRWARHEDKPLAPWKWGDAPRRPAQSFVERALAHVGGIAVFLTICVFGLHGLGIG